MQLIKSHQRTGRFDLPLYANMNSFMLLSAALKYEKTNIKLNVTYVYILGGARMSVCVYVTVVISCLTIVPLQFMECCGYHLSL